MGGIGPSRYAADSTTKNIFTASLLALLIPLQVQSAVSHRDQLTTNYTSAEAMSTMGKFPSCQPSQS
jgi:hypothetical protein